MTYEKLENSQVKATFEVSKEEWNNGLDAAFAVCNEKVTIKGFRKGKAPKNVYLKNYGVESLYEEAINQCVEAKMASELAKTTEFVVISQPELRDINIEEVTKGEGFKFALVFDVLPTVTLGQYKGIEVPAVSNDVTDEEVEASVKALFKDKAVSEEKAEQVIALGDVAVFDFVGSVDGVEFEGGSAENYELKIGSGQFIPGFEDQMVGMKKDEVKDINVTFPENYGAENLAGKPAVFKVTVHAVKTEVFPELNDDLVKSLGRDGIETVDALKASEKTLLESRKANMNARETEDKVFDQVVNNATLELPASFVAQRENYYVSQAEAQAKAYNIPLDMLLSFSGITVEQYKAQCHEQAVKDAKFDLVISQIAIEEKLTASDEEVEKAIASYAASQNKTVAQVKKSISVSAFQENLIRNKAVELVLSSKIVK